MELLPIIRVMEITNLRNVDEAEIRTAAERWAREEHPLACSGEISLHPPGFVWQPEAGSVFMES